MDRVEDALNATRAAVEEGIVPGGGVAYMCAMKVLEKARFPGEEPVSYTHLTLPTILLV